MKLKKRLRLYLEKIVLRILIIINTFSPISLSSRLNKLFIIFMAQNHQHGFARGMNTIIFSNKDNIEKQ